MPKSFGLIRSTRGGSGQEQVIVIALIGLVGIGGFKVLGESQETAIGTDSDGGVRVTATSQAGTVVELPSPNGGGGTVQLCSESDAARGECPEGATIISDEDFRAFEDAVNAGGGGEGARVTVTGGGDEGCGLKPWCYAGKALDAVLPGDGFLGDDGFLGATKRFGTNLLVQTASCGGNPLCILGAAADYVLPGDGFGLDGGLAGTVVNAVTAGSRQGCDDLLCHLGATVDYALPGDGFLGPNGLVAETGAFACNVSPLLATLPSALCETAIRAAVPGGSADDGPIAEKESEPRPESAPAAPPPAAPPPAGTDSGSAGGGGAAGSSGSAGRGPSATGQGAQAAPPVVAPPPAPIDDSGDLDGDGVPDTLDATIEAPPSAIEGELEELAEFTDVPGTRTDDVGVDPGGTGDGSGSAGGSGTGDGSGTVSPPVAPNEDGVTVPIDDSGNAGTGGDVTPGTVGGGPTTSDGTKGDGSGNGAGSGNVDGTQGGGTSTGSPTGAGGGGGGGAGGGAQGSAGTEGGLEDELPVDCQGPNAKNDPRCQGTTAGSTTGAAGGGAPTTGGTSKPTTKSTSKKTKRFRF